jgi:hypothetical protein
VNQLLSLGSLDFNDGINGSEIEDRTHEYTE